MASSSHTPKRRLADVLLGIPLSEYVAVRRAKGETWRDISYQIRREVDLDISHESLRHWFAADEVAA